MLVHTPIMNEWARTWTFGSICESVKREPLKCDPAGARATRQTHKNKNTNSTNKARKIHDRKCRCHVGDACQSINSFYEMNQMDKILILKKPTV